MNSKLASRRRWILLLILALFLILVTNIPRATAAPVDNILLQTTPVATPQPTPATASIEYGWQPFLMVVILLVILGLLFWFMFVWAQKLDQASYLGTLYRTTIQDIEFKRISSEFTDKWANRKYHREVVANPEWIKEHPIPRPPDGVEVDWRVSSLLSEYELPNYGYGLSTSPGDDYAFSSRHQELGYTPEDEKPNPDTSPQKRKEAWDSYRREVDQWLFNVGQEANRLYKADLSNARSDSQERAGQAINFDLSVLRGRGAEFVLQFSTVVIIIFAVLVLGVLGILDSQPISTLLAAIIGYVLGQSTSRARGGTGETVAGTAEEKTEVVAPKPAK